MKANELINNLEINKPAVCYHGNLKMVYYKISDERADCYVFVPDNDPAKCKFFKSDSINILDVTATDNSWMCYAIEKMNPEEYKRNKRILKYHQYNNQTLIHLHEPGFSLS
jgi:hypothetical protein